MTFLLFLLKSDSSCLFPAVENDTCMLSSQAKLPSVVFLLTNIAKHSCALAVPGVAVMTMSCVTQAVAGGAGCSVTRTG